MVEKEEEGGKVAAEQVKCKLKWQRPGSKSMRMVAE